MCLSLFWLLESNSSLQDGNQAPLFGETEMKSFCYSCSSKKNVRLTKHSKQYNISGVKR
jgi:hypothetical protein